MPGLHPDLRTRQGLRLLVPPRPRVSSARKEEAAAHLLELLGAGLVDHRTNLDILDTTASSLGPCTLLNQDYPYVGLVSGQVPPKELEKQAGKTLWLVLFPLSYNLPGTSIRLTSDDCLRLLHTPAPQGNKRPALAVLNQIAAVQQPICAEEVFRTSGGMSPRALKRHFHGRRTELAALRNLLGAADSGDWSAIQVIGGRRIGKTTLTQRMELELMKEEPKRVLLKINGQAVRRSLRGAALEHWLYEQIMFQLAEQSWKLEYSWFHPGNTNEQGNARSTLEKLLRQIKEKTGKIPLLLMDETDHFTACDERDGFSVFNYLRSLVQDHRIALIVTAYPHGRYKKGVINVLTHRTQDPLYNLFSREPVQLGPWSPDEAWEFLHGKLGGLGMVLPSSLRDEVLRVSRGIPWIVHHLGLELCQGAPGRRRLVTESVWRRARKSTLKAIYIELKETIRSAAENNDQQHGVAGDSIKSLATGDRLWNGLLRLASAHSAPVPVEGNDWPESPRFEIDELHGELGFAISFGRIREVLNEFTGTPLLAGDPASEDLYYFSHHLLPAWQTLDDEGD